MLLSGFVNENQLDEWVRGNAIKAQGTIVELVSRLVAASSPNPKARRFPLGDSIGQPGPDGELHTDFADEPFVPQGRSFWEIGTGGNTGDKATKDYRELTDALSEHEATRQEATFVFVSPLSGRKDWPSTWKENAQKSWLEKRRARKEWRDVRIIDGTILIDWLHHYPAVELWLAQEMGLPTQQIETLEQHWALIRSIGAPPPLHPQVFLSNREAACAKLKDIVERKVIQQLKLETRFPEQVVDFISAFVAALDDEKRADVLGRCIVATGIDAWNAIITSQKPHILVAGFDVDREGSGTILLGKARRAGHAVIYGGMPGGIPHPFAAAYSGPRKLDHPLRSKSR